jgi:uncharacterized protein involved in cysteine biosynthesis
VDETPEDDRRFTIGVGDGFSGFFNGICFIIGTPTVWIWAAVPMAWLLVLSCGGCGFGFWGAEALSKQIVQPETTWGEVGKWALTVCLSIFAFMLVALAALSLTQPLSGFALDRIAIAQEAAMTGRRRTAPSIFLTLWNSAKATILSLVIGSPILLVLLVIGLAFPPAAVVTVPLKFLVAGWMLAWNFIDYPLGLRRMGLRARIIWALQHFDAFTTFGVVWALLLPIPGVVLLVLPMGVAGVTRMVVQEEIYEVEAKEGELADDGIG